VQLAHVVLRAGVEPATFRLKVGRSTD